jgi:SAM-dependent methyltransferase
MISQWDIRYNTDDYVYGTNANEFFKKFLEQFKHPGKLLLPAEGEGRNAVYAAAKGWDVEAFDQSTVGKEKAEKLAKTFGVSISYQIADLFEYTAISESYDLIALIYVHIPGYLKKPFFDKMMKSLKPGGFLIAEVFSKEQLLNNSGGPRDSNMLYSIDEIESFVKDYECIELKEETVELNEGLLHKGKASVIRLICKK